MAHGHGTGRGFGLCSVAAVAVTWWLAGRGAIFPLWLWLAWRLRPQRFGSVLAAIALALVALVLVLAFTPRFKDRVDLAATEISGYVYKGQGNTSLGLRLAQYQLVAQLIPQKPWLGWGAHGFVEEMQRRVNAGEYVPEMMNYREVHNVFLDGWVKIGLGGLLLPVALHAWVLVMFWPSRKRMARHVVDTPAWRDVLALRVMGTVVPVGYLVFGMSQPFFNHNNGVMCFVFYVAVLWAALQGLERER
ncbi:O-antigen ligase family protein [Acidovorax carolinensis]|uniref:O-antigen ligase family protein n=1 Tax=Acidovorax carolinensis TaxID=553814 RepID=UPI001F4699BA|nr:O-antigen ligase family protein [Acidovorax carolinensis]